MPLELWAERMYSKIFKQLTLSELERYVTELETGLENHTRWLADINRVLICHLPPTPDDICEAPDHRCKFGRWYHGIDNPILIGLESFTVIDATHRAMHEQVKRLLLNAREALPCNEADYDKLIATIEQFRSQIHTLLRELNQNRDLSTRLMGTAFNSANEGVIITTTDGTIISANEAFSQVTGYTAEEVIGHTPSLLRSQHHDEQFYARIWQELQEYGRWEGKIWNRHKDGTESPHWLSIVTVKGECGAASHYVAILSDITTINENEKRLQYLAHHDQLTGLPNRILFQDRLRQAIAQAQRDQLQVAVMFLDLDGFKTVNDTLGHGAGDELLKQVAQRLTLCLRATDSVARFGGDEFTIVLPAIDEGTDVIRIALKIIDEIALPYNLSGAEASLTTSIGISLYPTDGNDPNTLIQRADNAMYHAKRHGKNHHEFYSEI